MIITIMLNMQGDALFYNTAHVIKLESVDGECNMFLTTGERVLIPPDQVQEALFCLRQSGRGTAS